jgi:multidrug efflux pump subunit AcrA (membrane-fusion protein)
MAQPLPPARGPVERDQQSAEFALRLRQQQQAAELERLRPGDVRLRQEMDTLHLQQRQRLESLDASQRLGLELRQSGTLPRGSAPTAAQLEQERIMVLDGAQRELAEQVRRAEREKAQGEPRRWGPTL